MRYLNYVNTKQGSKSTMRFSHGNTLPLVQRPFGFASFAPQTHSDRGNWYYHCDDMSLEGIRLTHQPSPWIGDHCAIVMLPQSETPNLDPWGRWSGFDKKSEVLMPHYLKYRFNKYFSTFELTPTEYGACVKIEFEKDFDKYLSIAYVSGICGYEYDAENNRLLCYTDCNYRVANETHIKGYFAFQFDEDTIDIENTLVEDEQGRRRGLSIEGEKTGIHLALKKKNIQFTLATSFISCDQALLNLKNDNNFESFESLKQYNEQLWENYLSRIEISADEDTMRTFYSCMYRSFLYPHKAYEIDENGKAIHYAPCDDSVKEGIRYTDNGFWDTYRTVYPFYALVAKEECREIIEGFIQDYIDGGWLPCWTAGDAKKCMPSTAIDAVIADAAVKGILSGELLETAFRGMEIHANNDSPLPVYGREGCSDYLELGYVPSDKYKESVNLTLDAAYFDYCLATVAGILGYDDKKEKYLTRAKNYANIFDSETGFMRGKDSQGNFRPGFDPISWGGDYTEAAAWQTSFAVQHDIEGLAQLHGGKDKLVEKLDALFAAPVEYRVGGYYITIHEMEEMAACDWGQCAVSNQPSFHIPFIYAYLGEKEKADYWIKKISSEGFSYRDDGFPGDEDNGSMALWYIFSCLGIYPICPGKAEYTITTPLVDKVKILGREINISNIGNTITYDNLVKIIENK
ncbi:MAG: GH92 family glycosyl hydrolase [Eubacteriales bacterium]|nr:GH92 family glycosyl hydrolase [Eubacteriales bacterium]